MKDSHHHDHDHMKEKLFSQVCDHLGDDINSPMCKEIKEHLENCSDCTSYIDSIKKAVSLCKENEIELKASEQCKQNIMLKMQEAIKKNK